jgi:hypothetical protein
MHVHAAIINMSMMYLLIFDDTQWLMNCAVLSLGLLVCLTFADRAGGYYNTSLRIMERLVDQI